MASPPLFSNTAWLANRAPLHRGRPCRRRHVSCHPPHPQPGQRVEHQPGNRRRHGFFRRWRSLLDLQHEFDGGTPDAADPLDRPCDRPDFQALIYPGRTARIVPFKESPPAFLAASSNDRPDISEGLLESLSGFSKTAAVPGGARTSTPAVAHGFGHRAGKTAPVVMAGIDRFYRMDAGSQIHHCGEMN